MLQKIVVIMFTDSDEEDFRELQSLASSEDEDFRCDLDSSADANQQQEPVGNVSSSDEDFSSAVAPVAVRDVSTTELAVQGQGPSRQRYLPLARVKCGRRLMPKETRIAVASGRPLTKDEIPRDIAKLVSAVTGLDDSWRVRSMTFHAELMGIHPSRYQIALYALGDCLYENLRRSVSNMAVSALHMAGDRSDDFVVQPLVNIKYRSYDGTRHRCRNVVQDSVLAESVDQPIVDCCISSNKEAHETISFIAKRACVLRKTYLDGRDTVMTMVANQPTVLQTAESTKAKTAKASLEQLKIPKDKILNETCNRTVTLSVTDDHPSNMLVEASIVEEEKLPDDRSALLRYACDCHKYAKMTAEVTSPMDKMDSRCVRAQLSTKSRRAAVRKHAREIMREQLVCRGGVCSSDAIRHRNFVLKTCIDGSDPVSVYRRTVLERLFNEDIRRLGEIPHLENGCCPGGRRETLYLMQTIGIRCMCWGLGLVLQRNNWTGSRASVGSIALPAAIHAIFEAAYMRSFWDVEVLQIDLLALADVPDGVADSGGGGPGDRQRTDEEKHRVSFGKKRMYKRSQPSSGSCRRAFSMTL